jgi:hypothetical protein
MHILNVASDEISIICMNEDDDEPIDANGYVLKEGIN